MCALKAPTTFGQQRAEAIEARLKSAIAKRRQLARAEFASEAPLADRFKQDGERTARQIGRLQQELKSQA
ncbi:MAG: hypothetical protein A3J60_02240 [Candidatus Pacebacteria bacterium RIFCSPHIGHO2_02_FULL_46_9]|nr:MAG: hypothetical protein A3J60_02240 [Candidatus Pacebacteria bacterium RIFCSPHIGHO2_02_FULL_46_9]